MTSREVAPPAYDITIAIPTYNGAERLPKLLEHLRIQTQTEPIRWEILVVDNNSQDHTAAVVQDYARQWLPNVPLRYAFEPRQGAAFARQTAVKSAAGELIGFLDDDNLPANNRDAEAVDFSRRYPQAGAFGGRIDGNYEVPPPEGFERIKNFLAIRNHGSEVMAFEPDKLQLPPAASLVIRRQAWLDSVPPQPTLGGKVAGLFVQGDDYEPLLYLHKHQWQILYDPALQTVHQIPPQRFERSYLLMLAKGCGLATCQLSLMTANPWRKPVIVVRTCLGSLKRLGWHILKHRGRSHADLATACEFEFHLGSLLSPLYVRRWS